MTDRDIEQVDYGYGFRGHNSPQQHMNLKIDGGAIALAFSLLAFGGVIVASMLIPQIIESRAREAAAAAYVTAGIAEREARVALDQIEAMRLELAKKGINITTDRH